MEKKKQASLKGSFYRLNILTEAASDISCISVRAASSEPVLIHIQVCLLFSCVLLCLFQISPLAMINKTCLRSGEHAVVCVHGGAIAFVFR